MEDGDGDDDETSSLAADRDEMHEWSSGDEEAIEAWRRSNEIEKGGEVGAPGRTEPMPQPMPQRLMPQPMPHPMPQPMPQPKELETFPADEWPSDGDDDHEGERGEAGVAGGGEFDFTCHEGDVDYEGEGDEGYEGDEGDEGDEGYEGDLTCQDELGPISPFVRRAPSSRSSASATTAAGATAGVTAGPAAGAPRRAGSLAPLRPCALAPYVEPAARSPRSLLLGLPYQPTALNRGRGAVAAALALSLKRSAPPKQVSILQPLKLKAQRAARGGGTLDPMWMMLVSPDGPETEAHPRKKQRPTPAWRELARSFPAL